MAANAVGLRKFKKQKLEARMIDTPIQFIKSTTARITQELLLFKFPVIYCYVSVFVFIFCAVAFSLCPQNLFSL